MTLTNCLVAENRRSLSLLNESMAETNRNILKLPRYNAIRKKIVQGTRSRDFLFFRIVLAAVV